MGNVYRIDGDQFNRIDKNTSWMGTTLMHRYFLLVAREKK